MVLLNNGKPPNYKLILSLRAMRIFRIMSHFLKIICNSFNKEFTGRNQINKHVNQSENYAISRCKC